MKLFNNPRIKTGPALKSVVTIVALHYGLTFTSDGVSTALAEDVAIASETIPSDSEPILKLARLLSSNPALGQWSEINQVRAKYLVDVAPEMAAKAGTEAGERISAADWLEGHCLRAERTYNRVGDAQGLFTGTAGHYQELSGVSNELIACVIALSWLETPEHLGTLPSGLQPGGMNDG